MFSAADGVSFICSADRQCEPHRNGEQGRPGRVTRLCRPSVPIELTGAFAGLYLAYQSFSSVSVMAVIVLTGMDLTTAILLIDQIARRRADPRLTREEAVALACRHRLRPPFNALTILRPAVDFEPRCVA
jgi:Cu/Ag efflux pump CusA